MEKGTNGSSVLANDDDSVPSTVQAMNPAPTQKILPNLHPKIVPAIPVQIHPQTNRSLAPRNGPITAQAVAPAPSGSIIIPQGCQHIIINGQLFPIVQTPQGALLIHQPVGQIQQPSQTTLPPNSSTATTFVNNATQSRNSIAFQHNSQPSTVPVSAAATAFMPIRGVQPVATTHVTPTNATGTPKLPGKKSRAPGAVGVSRPGFQATSGVAGMPPGTHQFQVHGKTHELLTQIITQINAFRQRPNPDEKIRSTIQQLEVTKEKILKEIKEQVKASRNAATATNQNNTDPKISQERTTLMQILHNAFANVKHGEQFYNIQLTETQKENMVTEMMPMTGAQRHSYLLGHQQNILKTFVANQKQGHTGPVPITTPITMLNAARPKTPNKSSTVKQRPTIPQYMIPSPPRTIPKEELPSTVVDIDKSKFTPTNRGRSHKAKRRTRSNIDKLVSLYEKDKDALSKGMHKRPFLSKYDMCQRLARYHVYHTPDPPPFKKEHDDYLFRGTAIETIERKLGLEQRLRNILWDDARSTTPKHELMALGKLALESEKEALETDKTLALEDIDKFKKLYGIPRKPVNQSPSKTEKPKSERKPGRPPKVSKAPPKSPPKPPISKAASPKPPPVKQRAKPTSIALSRPIINRATRTRYRERTTPRVIEPPPEPVSLREATPPKPSVDESDHSDGQDSFEELSPVKSMASDTSEWDFTSELKSALRRRSSEDLISSVAESMAELSPDASPRRSSLMNSPFVSQLGNMPDKESSADEAEEDVIVDIESPSSSRETTPDRTVTSDRESSPNVDISDEDKASEDNSPTKSFSIVCETMEPEDLPIYETDTNTAEDHGTTSNLSDSSDIDVDEPVSERAPLGEVEAEEPISEGLPYANQSVDMMKTKDQMDPDRTGSPYNCYENPIPKTPGDLKNELPTTIKPIDSRDIISPHMVPASYQPFVRLMSHDLTSQALQIPSEFQSSAEIPTIDKHSPYNSLSASPYPIDFTQPYESPNVTDPSSPPTVNIPPLTKSVSSDDDSDHKCPPAQLYYKNYQADESFSETQGQTSYHNDSYLDNEDTDVDMDDSFEHTDIPAAQESTEFTADVKQPSPTILSYSTERYQIDPVTEPEPNRVAPLRINKRKIAEYIPKEEEVRPAPIKIRIKRDFLNTWEASSISSSKYEEGSEEEINESSEGLEDGASSQPYHEDEELTTTGQTHHEEDEQIHDESDYECGQDTDDDGTSNPHKITIRFGDHGSMVWPADGSSQPAVPFSQYETSSSDNESVEREVNYSSDG